MNDYIEDLGTTEDIELLINLGAPKLKEILKLPTERNTPEERLMENYE